MMRVKINNFNSISISYKLTTCQLLILYKYLQTLRILLTIKLTFFWHFSGDRIACEVCLKTFKHSRDLKDHLNMHSGAAPQFSCSQCSTSFETRKKLLNHAESHRSTDEPCPQCGKTFKNVASRKVIADQI